MCGKVSFKIIPFANCYIIITQLKKKKKKSEIIPVNSNGAVII